MGNSKTAVEKTSKPAEAGIEIKPNIVYSTTEYTAFTNFPSNRDIPASKIRKLMNSMDAKSGGQYLVAPILVNEDLFIVDGQTRFAAARALGLPVYFIMRPGLTEDDMALYNEISKNWDLLSYLHYYNDLGVSTYVELNDYVARHDIGINLAFMLLTGNRNLNKVEQEAFESGHFEFEEWGDPGDTKAKRYMEVRQAISGYDPENRSLYLNNIVFMHGLTKFMAHPKYNHKTMMQTLTKTRGAQGVQAFVKSINNHRYKIDKVLDVLADIYNHGKHVTTEFFKNGKEV